VRLIYCVAENATLTVIVYIPKKEWAIALALTLNRPLASIDNTPAGNKGKDDTVYVLSGQKVKPDLSPFNLLTESLTGKTY